MADRLGIEIDYCPKCRGVWLDRGELDKIIERSMAEVAPVAAQPPYPQPPAPGYAPDYRDDYYDGHGRGNRSSHGGSHGGSDGGSHGSSHGGSHGGSHGYGSRRSLLGRLFD